MTGKVRALAAGGAAARKPRDVGMALSGRLSAASVLTTFLTPGIHALAGGQRSRKQEEVGRI